MYGWWCEDLPLQLASSLRPASSLRDPSPVLVLSLPPAPPALSPVPVSPVGCGLVPPVVEAAVLRGRTFPAVGRPAEGSSRMSTAGGDSSDDQRPVLKRYGTTRSVSPLVSGLLNVMLRALSLWSARLVCRGLVWFRWVAWTLFMDPVVGVGTLVPASDASLASVCSGCPWRVIPSCRG